MGIELSSGAVYITSPYHDPIELGNNLDVSIEYEISDKEVETISYKAYQSAEFSYELANIDLEFFNNISTFKPSDKFTLQYNTTVMRQKRWHKKARVNKKWFKRYGMVPDTVKVMTDATTLDYNCCQDYSFELDCSNHKYILRSDQQRRGLKIVW